MKDSHARRRLTLLRVEWAQVKTVWLDGGSQSPFLGAQQKVRLDS